MSGYVVPPEIVASLREAMTVALREEAIAIKEKAALLCPDDEDGAPELSKTGEVIEEQNNDEVSFVVGFGGTPETEPYAEIQHERMDLKHSPGKQAKFLEQPANEAMVGMSDRIAARIAQQMG